MPILNRGIILKKNLLGRDDEVDEEDCNEKN